MKATTKKLLCLLAVLILALSLAVPAAAETQADIDSWITKNANAFKPGETLPSTCPACGATNVNWTPLASTNADVEPVNTSFHAYLPEDITVTGGFNSLQTHNEKGATYCLYLNNHTMAVDGRIRLRSYATMNIFGDGKMVRNASGSASTMFAFSAYTTLNIYSGTFENKDADHAMISYQSTHQVINIYGGTFINSARFTSSTSVKMFIYGGTFDVDPTASLAEGYAATSADGIWTVAKSNETTDPSTDTNPGSADAPPADNSFLVRIIVFLCIGAVLINVLSVLLTIHILKRKYEKQ